MVASVQPVQASPSTGRPLPPSLFWGASDIMHMKVFYLLQSVLGDIFIIINDCYFLHVVSSITEHAPWKALGILWWTTGLVPVPKELTLTVWCGNKHYKNDFADNGGVMTAISASKGKCSILMNGGRRSKRSKALGSNDWRVSPCPITISSQLTLGIA